MKYFIFALFYLLLASTGYSQVKSNFIKSNNYGKLNNDNISYDYNGQVKNVYTTVYSAGDGGDSGKWILLAYDTDRYNSDGFKTDAIKYIPDQKEILRYIYKYDAADNETEERTFSPPFPGSAYPDTILQIHKLFTYKRNSKGYVIEQNEIMDGKFLVEHRYNVDSAGNDMEEREYTRIDTLTELWKYKFNKDGCVKEEKHYMDTTSLDDDLTMLYDSTGRKVETSNYDESKSFLGKQTFEYDKNGQLVGTNISKEDGTIYWYIRNTVSARDAQGNWLKETTRLKGKPYLKSERTIEYYK